MKNIEKINQMDSDDQRNFLNDWYDSNCKYFDEERTISPFEMLLKWLNEDYEIPLLPCPFKCPYCDQQVVIKPTINKPQFYYVSAKVRNRNYFCALANCNTFNSMESAAKIWNHMVSGEKPQ